ncbi:replication-associated recombination protein A [Microbacterium deminutum]
MRPTSLEEVAGQDHLLRPGSPLTILANPDASATATSVILWGPPGTGKTTLAQAIARSSGRRFVELSAVTAGVRDVREVMQEALTQRDLYGHSTILFLDEIHRFTKAQQDALLPGVENGWVVLIAATTENPSFSVISPLLSRSLLLTLRPLTDDDLRLLIDRAVADARGLAGGILLRDDARDALVRLSSGDARRALTALEAAASIATPAAEDDDGTPEITPENVADAVDRALLRYDRQGDEHYDVISAFIKSIRGSDVDAAVHYLARMIEAGEDPRFIARRLIISAAEDIGLADPQALVLAVAAADAVQLIGMPEGRIPLAEATVYLATTAKSNAAYLALDAALADVRNGGFGRVPAPLRDAHYPGAKRLGHGKGYVYPHDTDVGVVAQQHLPDELRGRRYYTPTSHGQERDVQARLEKIRRILEGG